MTPPQINCMLYGKGRCGHPAAPQPFLGMPQCVLINDPRINRCALQVQHSRPEVPPARQKMPQPQ